LQSTLVFVEERHTLASLLTARKGYPSQKFGANLLNFPCRHNTLTTINARAAEKSLLFVLPFTAFSLSLHNKLHTGAEVSGLLTASHYLFYL
jgi:hypothetical protein